MTTINIFVSFDLEHDSDLYDLLVEQSANASLGFEVSGRSEASTLKNPEDAGLRRRIREADQLRIAQEEQKPYFLLWGRRDSMCTKPTGAKASEGMYSWTSQILQDQVTVMTRNAHWETTASGMKRA
jgi:hypothetical protein